MSVAEIANTTVQVLRGGGENQFGDATDANLVYLSGVPAFLAETGKTMQDPSTPTPRAIRQVICHVPEFTGVLTTDRILDEATGGVYMVIGVTRPPNLTGTRPDLVLDLKRVTGVTA